MGSTPQMKMETRWRIARAFPRFQLNVKVTVTATHASGTQVFTGKMTDIGLGGLGANIEPPLLARERVWLEFILPMASEPLKVLAKVMHIEAAHHGFQFLNLTPEQRELIRRACESLPNV